MSHLQGKRFAAKSDLICCNDAGANGLERKTEARDQPHLFDTNAAGFFI